MIDQNKLSGGPQCPSCHQNADGYTGAEAPEAGNVAICGYCQHVGVYFDVGGSLSIRAMREEEKDQLKHEHPDLWRLIEVMVRQLRIHKPLDLISTPPKQTLPHKD